MRTIDRLVRYGSAFNPPPQRVLQKALTALMRHKSYSTTERYYLGAEALMSQAVEKIEVSPKVLEAIG